jgi:hypothetical protein
MSNNVIDVISSQFIFTSVRVITAILFTDLAFTLQSVEPRRDNSKDWVSNEIRNLSRILKTMFLQIQSSNDGGLRQQYSHLEKEYKILNKKTKTECNDQRFRNASNYSKVAWDIIKNNTNTNPTVEPDQIADDHGKTTANPVELSNALNHSFMHLPKAANSTQRGAPQINYKICRSMYLTPCSESELCPYQDKQEKVC